MLLDELSSHVGLVVAMMGITVNKYFHVRARALGETQALPHIIVFLVLRALLMNAHTQKSHLGTPS